MRCHGVHSLCRWYTQEGLPSNAISAPKLANSLAQLFRVGLSWCIIGIYYCAISFFLEPHHLHKALNHPVISKSIHHFYLQCPPSCKQFDPWGFEWLLSLLEGWAVASSLTTFKLACKIASLLALVRAKCSDLTFYIFIISTLFLWHNAANFILASCGKMDDRVIYHLKFALNLILMLIFALCFPWRPSYTILSLLGRGHMGVLFSFG